MTSEQRKQITELRSSGNSYGQIAKLLGLSKAQVSSYCRRKKLSANGEPASAGSDAESSFCKNCGKPIKQLPKHKHISFCSDKCCRFWWNHHPEAVHRRETAIYSYTCACCGKHFTAYGNNHRKYCSHECYIKDRFGGDRHDR